LKLPWLIHLWWKTFNFFEVSEITLPEEDGTVLFDVRPQALLYYPPLTSKLE
jgi:hypothetical protein